ncbi:MAG: glutaredoxin family protein [Polyangiaceae bacterium]
MIGRRDRARSWAAALLVALAAQGAACSGDAKDDGTKPGGEVTLPALTIKEDTPNLLLTWIDDRGDTHSAQHPSEVPQEGKSPVRVVVADREAGTRDPLYVVDLGQASADGSFTARAMARREWEGILEKRREAFLGKLNPKPPATPASGSPTATGAPPPSSTAVAAGLVVIIYGASWCKPCHQAQDYLRSRGIQVIMKDIEESQEAASEMTAKLEKANRRGGAIPVIDVRGQILVGYNRAELDQAVQKASAGTVL